MACTTTTNADMDERAGAISDGQPADHCTWSAVYAIKTPVGMVWVWILPLIVCSQLAIDMPQDNRVIGIIMMVLVLGLTITALRTLRILETRWARMEDAWEAPPCDMSGKP